MSKDQQWLQGRDQILQGMVWLLPRERRWTKAERDRWLDLFVRLVDYTIEVEVVEEP